MSEVPEGMVRVEDFALPKNIPTAKVINMIRDGFYVGRKVGEEWYIDPSEFDSSLDSSSKIEASHNSQNEVVVTDIKMPFLSMVVFMVKWVIASIPALIILFIVISLFSGFLIGVVGGLRS
jgi:hypothetical protein